MIIGDYMRIAVLSDIHGNTPALKAIIKDIKHNNVDKIIYLGDAIGIGPQPDKCLDLIMENNIEMVLGNHELYYVKGTNIDHEMDENEIMHHKWVKSILNDKHYDFLNKKTLSITLEEKGYKLMFQHFLIDENTFSQYPFHGFSVLKEEIINQLVDELDTNYIFIGHEHRPYEVKYNGKKLIDAGSSGCVYDNKTHYTVIDINDTIDIIRHEVFYDRDELISIFKNGDDYPLKDYLSDNFFGIK